MKNSLHLALTRQWTASGRSRPGLGLALVAALLLAGCATRMITGQPPQVSLHELSRDGSIITLELNLRNVNDEALQLTGVQLRLELDQQLLLQVEQPINVTVPARGRERIRLERVGGLAGLEALDALDSGQHTSRPWQLHGRLLSERGRGMKVEAEGWLYPVPGRDGRYR